MSLAGFALLADIALVVLGGLILVRGLRVRRILRRIPRLTSVSKAAPPSNNALPSLTIVVAARDEAAHLERAVTSWLAQDVPVLTIVAVDDRSRDATSDVLARLASADTRVRAMRIESRPADWLGKCHALATGAAVADGDYLLFTDADVVLAPGALRAALATCVAEKADFLVVLPEVETDHLVQDAFTRFFFHQFLLWLRGGQVNSDDGKCHIGVGAFNLVRRQVYEAVGGHSPIKLQIGDDVALARLVGREGYRHRVRDGRGSVSLRWQAGLLGTIRGLEKNAFWGARFSVMLVAGFTLLALVSLLPFIGPVVSFGPAGFAALGLALAGALLPHAEDQRADRALIFALLQPACVLLFIATMWNSMIRTLARGAVRWRDDDIPLPLLRSALLPLRWWLG